MTVVSPQLVLPASEPGVAQFDPDVSVERTSTSALSELGAKAFQITNSGNVTLSDVVVDENF